MIKEPDYEPVWGLPERLPEGEQILWQGRSAWWPLARHALYLPYIAAYLALMIAARAVSVLMAGASAWVTLQDAALFIGPSLGVLALILGFAWLVQRTTAYTITSRRVVFRIGIAFSMSVNIPYALVQSAACKLNADGTGDVSLTLDPKHRLSYVVFWPHVRPWHYTRPQPALRGIADAAAVAQILGRALAAASSMPVRAMPETARPQVEAGAASPQPA